jgi:ribosomal protein L11 methyltransferase
MSKTRIVEVTVAEADAEMASALLFEVGFPGLAEEASGRSVTLSTGLGDVAASNNAEQAFMREAHRVGLAFDLRCREIDSDWELAWTQHLEPIRIAPSLRLVPGPPTGQRAAEDLYLERELAFGFGEHPTTRMALRWLECRAPGKRVLDLGTGTGVLALAAAHFGAGSATGIDIDARSVEVARRNAVLNNRQEACTFSQAQLDTLGRDFDVAIANIDCGSLVDLAAPLCERVVTGGCIALTGLLVEQEGPVKQAFSRAGASLHRVDGEGDWVLLSTEV